MEVALQRPGVANFADINKSESVLTTEPFKKYPKLCIATQYLSSSPDITKINNFFS